MSPSGVISSASPQYVWNAESTATSYEIYVYEYATATTHHNSTLSAAAANCGSGTGQCDVTPAVTLPNGTYTWWVRGINGDGAGAWSADMWFTVSATGGVGTPTGNISTRTPTYTWASVAGAINYQVYTYNYGTSTTHFNSTLTAAQAGCGGGGTCTTTQTPALPQGEEYWWVRAETAGGWQAWSPNNSFTVLPVAPADIMLVSPYNSQVYPTPTFMWNATWDVDNYEIYIYNYDTATTALNQDITPAAAGCSAGTGTCSWTASTALATGTGYYWWIRPKNTSGVANWSIGYPFSVAAALDAPTLVSPTGSGQSTQPTYTWNEVSGATSYLVYVYDYGTATTHVDTEVTAAASCSGGTCSTTPPAGPATLVSGHQYYWWAAAKSATTTSAWSSPLIFYVQ
ncbi:MAG: hypothetical protein HS104_13580 [Polyangiaceae bacterium]|nr:hypothetical protein [Polyangiaceae bacterium]